MKYAFSIVACIALTSCVGKPVQEMSYTERRELAGQLVKRCMDQGVKLKTPEMEQCTKQEALREVTTRNNAPRWRFNPAGAGAALRGASQGYYRAAAVSSGNSSVTCTSVPSPAGYSSVRCR